MKKRSWKHLRVGNGKESKLILIVNKNVVKKKTTCGAASWKPRVVFQREGSDQHSRTLPRYQRTLTGENFMSPN